MQKVTTTDEPLPSDETLNSVDTFLDSVEAAQLQKQVDEVYASQPHRTPEEVEDRLVAAEETQLKSVLNASIDAAEAAGIEEKKIEMIAEQVSALTSLESARSIAGIFILQTLLLERKIGPGHLHGRHPPGLHFHGLAFALRGHQGSADNHAGAGSDLLHLLVAGQIRIRHDLQVGQGRAVVELEKGEALAGAPGTHPALYPRLPADGIAGEQLGDSGALGKVAFQMLR